MYKWNGSRFCEKVIKGRIFPYVKLFLLSKFIWTLSIMPLAKLFR